MGSREDLDVFRKTHQVQQTTIAGKAWFYYSGGNGDRTVVILPGAGAFGVLGAEVMFPVISALERQFRVFSFGYPTNGATVRELVEGIQTILDEQNVQQSSFLGHSLGSLITLCFLSTYPQKVSSVSLANFALPSLSQAQTLKRVLSILVLFPAWMTFRVVKAQFRRLLKSYADDFWLSYLTGKEAASSMRHMTTHYRCMLDFLRHWHISKESFASWHGKALILESDRERGVTPEDRANMQALFVNPSTHMFHNAGHLSFVTHTEEFNETVMRFLQAKQENSPMPY